MPYKDVEKRREAIRRHYYNNKAAYLAKNNRRRRELKNKINSLKQSTPCADCNKSYPYYVMDFDHLGDKKFLISHLVKVNNLTLMKKELAKCEIVCANCHRIRTHQRLKKSNAPL